MFIRTVGFVAIFARATVLGSEWYSVGVSWAVVYLEWPGEGRDMGSFLFSLVLAALVLTTSSDAEMCDSNTECDGTLANCCRGVCTSRRNCDGFCLVDEDCNIYDKEVCVSGSCVLRPFEKTTAGTPSVRSVLRQIHRGGDLETPSSESNGPSGFTDKTLMPFAPQMEYVKGSEIPVTVPTTKRTTGSTEMTLIEEDFIIAFVGLFLLVLNVIAVSYCISRASAKRVRTESRPNHASQGPINRRLERPRAFVIDIEPEVVAEEARESLPPYDFSAAYQVSEVFCSEVQSGSSGTISDDNAPPPYYANAVRPLQPANSFQGGSTETPTDTTPACAAVAAGEAEQDGDDPPPYRSISSERLDVLPPSYEEMLRKPDDYSEVTTGL